MGSNQSITRQNALPQLTATHQLPSQSTTGLGRQLATRRFQSCLHNFNKAKSHVILLASCGDLHLPPSPAYDAVLRMATSLMHRSYAAMQRTSTNSSTEWKHMNSMQPHAPNANSNAKICSEQSYSLEIFYDDVTFAGCRQQCTDIARAFRKDHTRLRTRLAARKRNALQEMRFRPSERNALESLLKSDMRVNCRSHSLAASHGAVPGPEPTSQTKKVTLDGSVRVGEQGAEQDPGNTLGRAATIRTLWDAAFKHNARFVWVVEMDVAVVGDWGLLMSRIDQSDVVTDLLHSGEDRNLLPHMEGNMKYFINDTSDWRRTYLYLSRFSPRLIQAMHEHMTRGMHGYMEMVVPSLCQATASCVARGISQQYLSDELWFWTPSCVGLSQTLDAIQTLDAMKASVPLHRMRFAHPVKWDAVLSPQGPAHYRPHTDGPFKRPWQVIINSIRKDIWVGSLPRGGEDDPAWQALPAVVRDRCRKAVRGMNNNTGNNTAANAVKARFEPPAPDASANGEHGKLQRILRR